LGNNSLVGEGLSGSNPFLSISGPQKPRCNYARSRRYPARNKGIKILATHPEVGRPIEDLPPNYRELVIEFGQGGYIVRYRFDAEWVVIRSVRHGREAGY
jgi:plasmid stabilization system protein ParE